MISGLVLTRRIMVNVERLCAERDLTIRELAKTAKISEQYLYLLRCVGGTDRTISLEIVAKLADALEVSAADLLREHAS